MIQIIIWGTSIKARKIMHFIDYEKVKIVGFTDNNLLRPRADNFIGTYPYIPWEEILQAEYDYIVIASNAFCEITDQLLFNDVPEEKIIQAYNCQFMFPDSLFFFNRLETDEKKYEIFSRFSTFCFETGAEHL